MKSFIESPYAKWVFSTIALFSIIFLKILLFGADKKYISSAAGVVIAIWVFKYFKDKQKK